MGRKNPSESQTGHTAETPRATPTSPLDERHFAMVRQASQGRKAVEKMIRRTRSSSLIALVLGVVAIGIAFIWPGWENVLIAVALCAIGAVELWGHHQIRQVKSRAATVLGSNQLALLLTIIAYCTVQMAAFSSEEAKGSALSPELRAQLDGLLVAQPTLEREIDQWMPILTYGFYGLIIVISIGFQGGMARYYFRNRRYIDAFNRETPSWIRRLFVEMGR